MGLRGSTEEGMMKGKYYHRARLISSGLTMGQALAAMLLPLQSKLNSDFLALWERFEASL